MITTATIGEIPAGVIADILGKKPSVILAFFLGAAGNLLMAFAPNYPVLVVSIIAMTAGGAFYSGSLEALVYDSLKEIGKSDLYEKVIGRMTTMQNLGMALAGITGGFLYKFNVSLPFLMVALAYLIGMVISLLLVEPLIDSEKYSLKKFINQNTAGFKELFANQKITIMVLAFLVPGAFMVASENVLNDATAVELGFDSIGLGIFTTGLYLFSVAVSEKTDWLSKKFNFKWIYLGSILIYSLTLIAIPKAAIVFGAILLLLRHGVQTFFGNYQSIRLNKVISSKYRVTTLSTFSLLRNIPYVLTATFIGALMNIYSAKLFSFYFGIIFLISLLILYLFQQGLVRSKD